MKKVKFILKYFKYYFSAKTKHGIHSPFVFDLATSVLENKNQFYDYEKIEKLRSKLLENTKEIFVTDLGAGKSGKRRICDIAKQAEKSKKYGQLLFRLVNKFRPETILDLGTSLGITTLYLASANKQSKVITIEGCPETAKVAEKNFKKYDAKNIQQVIGNFDDVLVSVRAKHNQLDFVFFDGNHKKEPTLRYFTQCLQYINNDSVFVFDDIHWSDEMEEAWEEIKNHSEVTVTMDLFFLGIVFFRKEQSKEHFIVRF